MKKYAVSIALVAFAGSSNAFWGMGDITFDPTSYANAVKQFTEIQNLYKTAMNQLDNLKQIQSTIKEAQKTYETLSSGNLKDAMGYVDLNRNNTKTIKGMREELDKISNAGSGTISYIDKQKALISQLEAAAKLKSAAADNVKQASGNINPATAEKVAAQSTSAIAALLAADEERKLKAEYEKSKASKINDDAFKASMGIYKAIGR
jgi:type IV secretion system protein TrbJ